MSILNELIQLIYDGDTRPINEDRKKTVRYKHPNQHKTKTFEKFSFADGDAIVYDSRYTGEPFQKRKGEVARYHKCRKKGAEILFVYNPRTHSFNDQTCEVEQKPLELQSESYCDLMGMPTIVNIARNIVKEGYEYSSVDTEHIEGLSELSEGFRWGVKKMYRGLHFQNVMNNNTVEKFLRYKWDYGQSLYEMYEHDKELKQICDGINNLG